MDKKGEWMPRKLIILSYNYNSMSYKWSIFFYSLELHQLSSLPIAVRASRFHLEPVVDAFLVEHVPAFRHSTHIISRDDIVAANRAALNLNWWSEVRILAFLYLRFRLLILL
jgi:hypothetical protein